MWRAETSSARSCSTCRASCSGLRRLRRRQGVRPTQQPVAPAPDVLDQAVGLIASAPTRSCWRGAERSAARDALVRLADGSGHPWRRRCSVPTCSAASRSISASSAHCRIRSPPRRSCGPTASSSFGASLTTYTTDGGKLLRGKRVVQCDVMPAAFGRAQQSDVAVIGDAGVVAEDHGRVARLDRPSPVRLLHRASSATSSPPAGGSTTTRPRHGHDHRPPGADRRAR